MRAQMLEALAEAKGYMQSYNAVRDSLCEAATELEQRAIKAALVNIRGAYLEKMGEYQTYATAWNQYAVELLSDSGVQSNYIS